MSSLLPHESPVNNPSDVSPAVHDRFWARVERGGDDDCWVWTGGRDRHGYGRIQVAGRETGAHRASYVIAGNSITPGLVLDHLCRNRACVNPAHLEPVTNQTNSQRAARYTRESCVHGHLFSEHGRFARGKDGYLRRLCTECNRARLRKFRAKQAGA